MVEFTAGEFSTLMSTNFESVFHLCQLAYPLLRESKAGSVVFISSVSGFVSLKNMSVQSSTKGRYLFLCSIHSFIQVLPRCIRFFNEQAMDKLWFFSLAFVF